MIVTVMTHSKGYEDRHFCPMALDPVFLHMALPNLIEFPDFQKLLNLKCCNQETVSHQGQRNETEGRRHPGAVWYATHKTPRFMELLTVFSLMKDAGAQ